MPCYLTIFSEKGFPHSAVMLEVNGKEYWLGFGPRKGHTYIGAISWANRERWINHYVRYEIPCHKAQEVIRTDFTAWDSAFYVFGFQDCVSFAADVARTCGLNVNSVNLTPYGLVVSIAHANPGYTHYNVTPFPWNPGTTSTPTGTTAVTPTSTTSGGYGPGAGPGVLTPNFNPPI